jgi:WhiB family redox-sensing transcriptional regulator
MISADTELMRSIKLYMEKEWNWMARAECRDKDPELFYAENGKFSTPKTKTAIRICRDCPVIKDCLNWALATGDSFGVLGGMTPQQRTRYRRDMEYNRTLRKIKLERGY